MAQAHTDPARASRQVQASGPGRGDCVADPANPEPVFCPVPVRGLIGPGTGTRFIRRQKADAVRYANDNGIDIEVTRANVTNYVNDKGNDANLRKGLLEAWNLNASSQWLIDTPADLAAASANPYHHSVFAEYQNFTQSSTGVMVNAFGGPISAYYNRGAPKLGSVAADWGNAKLGDSYAEYIRGLRSGGLTDRDIASALLTLDESVLASHLEKRAAAMLTVTVYLAEEWRKQGAAKIYRAILRLIEKGTRTFDQFLNDFEFVGSADLGRRQVGRFYDVWVGDADRKSLGAVDAMIYDEQSEIEAEDYSSDEDMRTDEKKNLKKKRHYAKKHNTS